MEEKLIESYTIKELEELEGLNYRTIKTRYNYIPIKFINWQSRARMKAGASKRDYMIKYVRLEDILKLLQEEIDFSFVRKKKK